MEGCWNDIDRGDKILMEHDGQCTYNVTLRRVRATTVTMYRVIHKSLRNFQIQLRNNQDIHSRKEHITR